MIGVMVFSLKPYEPEHIFSCLGVKAVFFTPGNVLWSERKVDGLLYQNGEWRREVHPFPAVVFNRCYSKNRRLVRLVTKMIGKHSFFNYTTRFNKWKVYQLLGQTEIKAYLPLTWRYQTELLHKLLERHQSVVLKPVSGHYGEDVFRVEKLESGEFRLYGGSDSFFHHSNDEVKFLDYINRKTASRSFVLQQFLPLARLQQRIFEIRLFVQKDHQAKWVVSCDLGRIGMNRFWITNIGAKINRGTAVLAETGDEGLMAEMKVVSVKVAKILDRHLGLLGELSVDFGIDENGKLWIIEVNGMPTKSALAELGDQQLEERVHLLPFQYAEYLLARKAKHH